MTTFATIMTLALAAWGIIRLRSRRRTPRAESAIRDWRDSPATMLWAVDGDTVDVEMSGARERIRIVGIDAPESCHPDESANSPQGEAATMFARSLCRHGMPVWVEPETEGRDAYGRLLAHVWLADPAQNSFLDASMSARMLESGHATLDTHLPNVRHAAALAACWHGLVP